MGIIIGCSVLAFGAVLTGVIKMVPTIRAKREKAKKFNPVMCMLHDGAIQEIIETQTFLKKVAQANIEQQYAYLVKRQGGKVNGEQERADASLKALILEHSELKIQ
jgi:hypothetical protein